MRRGTNGNAMHSLGDRDLEQRLFTQRLYTLSGLMIVLFAVLAARITYLQIVGNPYYVRLSRANAVKIAPLPPARGLIYDRNGKILAENVPTYSVEVVPEQVDDLQRTLADLRDLLGLSDEEVRRFEQERKQRKSFDSIAVRLNPTEDEVAQVAVRLPHLAGVDIKSRLVRRYPYGALTAHLVGYVGRINEQDMQRIDLERYQGTHNLGKTGIEKYYEDILLGKPGYEEIETNVQGRPVNVLSTTLPQSGQDLRISLDVQLQKTAEDALGEYTGSVVAIEPHTGEVVALVSKPAYDPNPFVYGIPQTEYLKLQKDPDHPLVNRALQGLYPPGSTFKPFVALAGLGFNVTEFRRRTFCPGSYRLPGQPRVYRCWNKRGHGLVDMRLAIVQSCDVYFYELAKILGIDRMDQFMTQFGFGVKSHIDVSGEKAGLFPNRAWKRQRRGQVWYPGETIITGIGQGYTLVTPLQLARATAILANHGQPVRPHLLIDAAATPVAATTPPAEDGLPSGLLGENGSIHLEPQDWQNVIGAMVDVVARGTARGINSGLRYPVAGKTGTAQVYTLRPDEKYDEHKIDKRLRDHALFIAFAPADQPRLAVAVIAENGGHGGSVAAPIARQVLDKYMELYPGE